MSEEILINVTPKETRVAIIENSVVQEILIERTSKKGIVGNIYIGKIVRVLPGMQAAFVEIGLERAAFLHMSDIVSLQNEDYGAISYSGSISCISEILSEGQQLAVQITKDPMGSKGARLTTRISLPSRYLVFMPDVPHMGISQKIEELPERERLRKILENNQHDHQGGYIIRTAAENASEEDICASQQYLAKYWQQLKRKIHYGKPGDIIHEDLPLFLRAFRDLLTHSVEKIRMDSSAVYPKALSFLQDFMPKFVDKLELYNDDKPIFDLYQVEDELQKALLRKVTLKSGGHLIFDQTEAMTTIDVNTGAFVGHRNVDETIFKTNLEAATTIARQLRLRNIGGIIIIDFIDMMNEEHKKQVLRALEKALGKDHAKSKISEVSDLGLVEMTRKRTQDSLEHILCEPCPTCQGRATVKTIDTVCYEIFREVLRNAKAYETKSILVLASQEVVDRMQDEESAIVALYEDLISKSIKFQVETLYTQEQYDVVLM